jgi:hypothetical protein
MMKMIPHVRRYIVRSNALYSKALLAHEFYYMTNKKTHLCQNLKRHPLGNVCRRFPGQIRIRKYGLLI